MSKSEIENRLEKLDIILWGLRMAGQVSRNEVELYGALCAEREQLTRMLETAG